LITGFLGSGKTTSILHLLAHKPADEKWAVLVNEFGEVGIDGALLPIAARCSKKFPAAVCAASTACRCRLG
jgi:G3E family GTPase